jgi:ketosteroid isomerase-like protein
MKDEDIQLMHDHVMLRNLYAKYSFGLDYHDDAALLDCFTPDGTFALSDRGDFVGHERIQRILDASAGTRNRHTVLNVVIHRVEGDKAFCRAYFILLHPGDASIQSYGHYVDDAVRCDDGQWRWTKKRVNFDWRDDVYAVRSEAQTSEKLLKS